ncbi:MAG: DUF1003 domain-containing protein [Gemmatimonadales bacterium]
MPDLTKDFRPPPVRELAKKRKPLQNVNAMQNSELSRIDRVALYVTDHVGTIGFFFLIFLWTAGWCGYNLLASEVPALHWKAFDPFPAFVAYLLISNVIQILLMPLIMVGQNLQGRHAELRAENDFEVNVRAEGEIQTILQHLEYQNAVLITMLRKLGVSPEEAIASLQEHGVVPRAT